MRWRTWQVALVAICFLFGGAWIRRLLDPARIVRSSSADMIRMGSDYAILGLHSAFMEQSFGSDWDKVSFFYLPDTMDFHADQTPLMPLAKGRALILIPGRSERRLRVLLFGLETERAAILAIDTRTAEVRVERPPQKLKRAHFINASGRLVFLE